MKLARPDDRGRFGDFGGMFAPETLMPALFEVEAAFVEAWADDTFHAELNHLLRTYVGRPITCSTSSSVLKRPVTITGTSACCPTGTAVSSS